MYKSNPRGIVVIDVGYTNTKAILFSPDLKIVEQRMVASSHRKGADYNIIDPEPILKFLISALQELDTILPVDVIVPAAHGACVCTVNGDGHLAFPIMDYASQPPRDVIEAYRKIEPLFSECYCTLLPMALTQAMQLFWQSTIDPEKFKTVKYIMPWIQYISYRLSGIASIEISSMACQSQLLDVNTARPSSIAQAQGWAACYPPLRNAWEKLGKLRPEFGGNTLNGAAQVLVGVHDSNANYLRYQAGGSQGFTLLSTGTWIISFNSAADITKLDPTKDTNTNTSVFGKPIACSRFFGGKELELLSAGAPAELADLRHVQKLIDAQTFALPSFTDSGGPIAGTGNQGRILGSTPLTETERASLAALYCALMVSEQLDAVASHNQIIVDGPFAKHQVFLRILAQLRSGQTLFASDLRDGTAAGAACLALMQDGVVPKIEILMTQSEPANLLNLETYQKQWAKAAQQG